MTSSAKRIIDARHAEFVRARSGERLENISARNVGNGLIRIDKPADRVIMRNVDITGGYRAFETLARKGGQDASVSSLLIDNVRATGLQRGFARIGYNSSKGTIRGVRAKGMINNDDIPCGIAFMDSAHNFSIEDCSMSGFRMEPGADAYWNGDGYSAERGNYGLRFLRCEAWDCTDGGFDLKSTGTFLDGCVAGRNKYNYRFWSTLEAHHITSLDPRAGKGRGGYGHISISADLPVTLHIGKLVVKAKDTAPLFTIHKGVTDIFIANHDIDVPPGTPLVAGEGRAVFHWANGPPKL